MKKFIYAPILLLVVVSGLVYAHHEFKNESGKKSTSKPVTAAEKNNAVKQWEATPEGVLFKKWEASPEGKKVLAAEDAIWQHLKDYTNIEATVISLSLPQGSRLGFGVMVRINDNDYILGYGPVKSSEMQQLQSLKVADKIIIRSHSVLHAPKYSYPIISISYIERDNKIIYKRVPGKSGC